MIRVAFSAAEWEKEHKLSSDRIALKEQHGVKNLRITRHKSDHQIAFEGNLAELAVARALGITSSKAYDVSIQGDGQYGDLTLPSGETISVKYSGRIGGEFALRSADMSEFHDDYGVLVYPLDEQNLRRGMVVMGYISRPEFAAKHHTHNYGYGDRAVVGLEDLRPIQELKERVDALRGKQVG